MTQLYAVYKRLTWDQKNQAGWKLKDRKGNSKLSEKTQIVTKRAGVSIPISDKIDFEFKMDQRVKYKS